MTAQKYVISPSLANFLAKKSNQRLRNSLRLWFWLKTHGYPSSLKAKELRTILKAVGFHTNQQKKYLFFLQNSGFLGRDRHGKVFLRGSHILFAGMEPSKTGRRKVFDVPPECTEDQKLWIEFLAGCQVVHTQDQIKKYTDKRFIRFASTHIRAHRGNAEATNDKSTPVSISILSKSLDVSLATASRLRSRASRGWIKNQRVSQDVSDKFPWVKSKADLMAARGMIKEYMPNASRQRQLFFNHIIDGPKDFVVNPDALLWIDGKVIEIRSNMVENIGIEKRKKRV